MGIDQAGPSDAEMINMKSEAEDTNKMVDAGLLTTKEAASFDYESEVDIQEALLSTSPKISERLRGHVISKFTADDFKPENAIDTPIHGTQLQTLEPLFSGKGELHYAYGHTPRSDAQSKKGIFDFHGWFTILGPEGFAALSETTGFPIVVVFKKNENTYYPRLGINKPTARKEYQLAASENEAKAISQHPRAIILEPTHEIDTEIETYKDYLRNNKSTNYDSGFFIYEMEKTFGKQIEKILDPDNYQLALDLLDWYRDWRPKIAEDTKLIYIPGIEDIVGIVDKLKSRQSLSEDEEKTLKHLYCRKLITDYDPEEFNIMVQEKIDGLEDYKRKNSDKIIYNLNGQGRQNKEFLEITRPQMINYIANAMVQGVDKSKIVPIYDGKGNLLWPREEDVKEEQATELKTNNE